MNRSLAGTLDYPCKRYVEAAHALRYSVKIFRRPLSTLQDWLVLRHRNCAGSRGLLTDVARSSELSHY